MSADLDQRTYDLLQLIEQEQPIGSIRLVSLMRHRGYSIGDRSIRQLLSDLDERGLTAKTEGKGRRITEAGRNALRHGNVRSRLAWVRSRIASLTSQVTYDPIDDSGALVASAAFIDRGDVGQALQVLESFESHPLGPCPVTVMETPKRGVELLLFPSSITIDGVLLSRGIDADLKAAGLVEYSTDAGGAGDDGGTVVRYVDTISGEHSTVDVVTLLIEAGRTRTSPILENGDDGLLIVDNREFPLTRYDESHDLAKATRASLGGVIDIRRPREAGPFPLGEPGREFGSLTYGGCGEIGISLLAERGLSEEWVTLYGTVDRATLDPVSAVVAESDFA